MYDGKGAISNKKYLLQANILIHSLSCGFVCNEL